MRLAQHHLQARDRYFENAAEFTISALLGGPYGIVGLVLDEEALENGTAAIVSARGVMPDGLAFAFPDEPLPDPLDVRAAFDGTADSQLLSLAIPAYRPTHPNCALPGDHSDGTTRYVAATMTAVDETTGADKKTIDVARKAFFLTLEDADPEGTVALVLARVRRDRHGAFVYDRDFVPPCLRIGASRGLVEQLRRLLDVLEVRRESLAAERGRARAGGAFTTGEIASFWLSHTINSGVAPLRHYLETRAVHPEEVYTHLLQHAGALCTFSMDSQACKLPPYDHNDLGGCFFALYEHIRRHLDVVVPERASLIDLHPEGRWYYAGQIADERALRNSHWFLAVRVEGARHEIISDVPKLVKICSAKFIKKLVERGMEGLDLTHMPAAPSSLPRSVGTEFFRIETVGKCWESIEDTKAIGVYAPGRLESAELKIHVVVED
jgi:type VI secretion system protein ImpJ